MTSDRELLRRYQGFPWCDICEGPAVLSTILGMVHTSRDFPSGIPPHLDPEKHEVTMKRWYNAPRED